MFGIEATFQMFESLTFLGSQLVKYFQRLQYYVPHSQRPLKLIFKIIFQHYPI